MTANRISYFNRQGPRLCVCRAPLTSYYADGPNPCPLQTSDTFVLIQYRVSTTT
jgi:hypothetical protein